MREELLREHWKVIDELWEEQQARNRQLRENAPSARDFYCLLRDTDFAGSCKELIHMMFHPYLLSVPLGTSKYGEYNIRLSTWELQRREQQRLPVQYGRPPPRIEYTPHPGQRSPLDSIDSGPENLRYYFQLGKLTTAPTLKQQSEISTDYVDTGYVVVVNAIDDSLWFIFNPSPKDDNNDH